MLQDDETIDTKKTKFDFRNKRNLLETLTIPNNSFDNSQPQILTISIYNFNGNFDNL